MLDVMKQIESIRLFDAVTSSNRAINTRTETQPSTHRRVLNYYSQLGEFRLSKDETPLQYLLILPSPSLAAHPLPQPNEVTNFRVTVEVTTHFTPVANVQWLGHMDT